MKNTIVVNLIAAPSSGKSTMMSGIFSELKWRNIDCEIVTEFAKDLVWEDRQETFKDELYIFAKQAHRLFRVNGKVDVLITDRPLILTQLYNNKYGEKSKELNDLCFKEFNKYNNFNYYINRKKKYNPNGRNQTEEESNEIAKDIKHILQVNNIEFVELDGTKENINVIVDDIIKALNRKENDMISFGFDMAHNYEIWRGYVKANTKEEARKKILNKEWVDIIDTYDKDERKNISTLTLIPFTEVLAGDVFMYQDKYYIKTYQKLSINYNIDLQAINLSSGTGISIAPHQVVTLVDCELNIL